MVPGVQVKIYPSLISRNSLKVIIISFLRLHHPLHTIYCKVTMHAHPAEFSHCALNDNYYT